MPENKTTRENAAIDKARKVYAIPSNDNLEIDDAPETSDACDGVWVAAWVWVPDSQD